MVYILLFLGIGEDPQGGGKGAGGNAHGAAHEGAVQRQHGAQALHPGLSHSHIGGGAVISKQGKKYQTEQTEDVVQNPGRSAPIVVGADQPQRKIDAHGTVGQKGHRLAGKLAGPGPDQPGAAEDSGHLRCPAQPGLHLSQPQKNVNQN